MGLQYDQSDDDYVLHKRYVSHNVQSLELIWLCPAMAWMCNTLPQNDGFDIIGFAVMQL
jgi:hypothetical protein